RVTDYEIELMGRFAASRPLVIVLTRCDLVAADTLRDMQISLTRADIPHRLGVVAVAADPLPVLGIAPFGLAELITRTDAADANVPQVEAAPQTASAPDVAEPAESADESIAAAATTSETMTTETTTTSASATQDIPAPQSQPQPAEARRPALVTPVSPAPTPSDEADFDDSHGESPFGIYTPGVRAGTMELQPVEEGPSTTSLLALAAVLALAIALLLLQLRRRDEKDVEE
ncbi:MAG TPA: hypothetical protein VKQ36_04460, partial [Ktedonobacterales bacterium]|nr:hypothetical protein [Ktedonobacterales bacterium]